jgi:hypothetical protein
MMMVVEKSLELFVNVPGPLKVGIKDGGKKMSATKVVPLKEARIAHGPEVLTEPTTQSVESPLMLKSLSVKPALFHVAKSKVVWLSTVSWKLGNSNITCATVVVPDVS